MTNKTHLTAKEVFQILKDAEKKGIEANFDNKIIVDKLDFMGYRFSVSVSFSDATFKDEASFVGATFERNAYFGGATFERYAYFVGATFKCYASFMGATFDGYTSFINALFNYKPCFDGVKTKSKFYKEYATVAGKPFNLKDYDNSAKCQKIATKMFYQKILYRLETIELETNNLKELIKGAKNDQ